ncbi:hypothetical protein FXO37_28223 [Capsicum annuum]|nr:hypothetical protein FXO37_28223 [Capsicum annuum]
MATSLTMAARRVAAFNRLPTSTTSTLVQRRSFTGAAGDFLLYSYFDNHVSDHHGPPKVNCWKEPMNPAQWKEEHFVIVSLSGWGLLFYGGYKLFTGGKKNKEEVLVCSAESVGGGGGGCLREMEVLSKWRQRIATAAD